MRLIDADKLHYKTVRIATQNGIKPALVVFAKEIQKMPAIPQIKMQVDPAKRGEWVNDKGIYRCTACNTLCAVAGWAYCIPPKQMYEVFKFCPECGAKMDGVGYE